jgi:hypothetical protein
MLEIGALEDRQLPYKREMLLFSPTRSSMRVKAQVDHEGRPPQDDPVEIGPVVPATEAEYAALWANMADSKVPVLCAYKVVLTLRDVSASGKVPFELGAFRRYIEFRNEDEAAEPQQTPITGSVESLVRLDAEGGQVVFGPFPRTKGTEKKVLLESDTPGLELEVDQARTPAFLESPRLEPLDVSSTGHQSWRLTLKVRPDALAGRFPNQADPKLRDSAVYITAREKTKVPRTIRIPVTGAANID